MQIDDKIRDKLKDVMVITVKKSFWASRECEIFPVRVYAHKIYGYSQNLPNSLLTAVYGLKAIIKYRPKLIFFGSSGRLVPWFLRLRRLGLLKHVKIIATNQSFFDDKLARYVDRIIVYSYSEIESHDPELNDKYVFVHLPADGDFDAVRDTTPRGYIFSGGGAGRDFKTLIEAVKGLDIPLKIVTFTPKNLKYRKKLPENVDIEYRMPLQSFLERVAHALFVVVPLKAGKWPHGHTSIVQALRLGKPVITSKNSTTEDYVVHGENGFLVDPGDTKALQDAIKHLYTNKKELSDMSKRARISSRKLTYSNFADFIVKLCMEMLDE